MTNICDLPWEVLLIALDLASRNPKSPYASPTLGRLYQLALVNRTWYTLINPQLYKKLFITSHEKAQSFMENGAFGREETHELVLVGGAVLGGVTTEDTKKLLERVKGATYVGLYDYGEDVLELEMLCSSKLQGLTRLYLVKTQLSFTTTAPSIPFSLNSLLLDNAQILTPHSRPYSLLAGRNITSFFFKGSPKLTIKELDDLTKLLNTCGSQLTVLELTKFDLTLLPTSAFAALHQLKTMSIEARHLLFILKLIPTRLLELRVGGIRNSIEVRKALETIADVPSVQKLRLLRVPDSSDMIKRDAETAKVMKVWEEKGVRVALGYEI